MRTNKTASHIYYELDHDVQEYAKRLLAKKILHAAQQNNAAPLSDKTAKKTAETAVFLTERLALLYELNSGFRGIRFSTFGEQPAVYTTMVQHNAPLYDELMLGRAYNLANYLTADNEDIKESALMKHKVLAAIYSAAAYMKGQTPEQGKISIQNQLFVSTAVELFDGLLSAAEEKKERQGHKCPLCVANGINTEYAFEDMEGDHIIPWSKGGHTTDDNLQMLCKKCNAAKSDM